MHYDSVSKVSLIKKFGFDPSKILHDCCTSYKKKKVTNYICKSLFLLNELFVRVIFGCVAAPVCHANCGHLSVLLAVTVQNMWGLQLYFNTNNLSVQGGIIMTYKHY